MALFGIAGYLLAGWGFDIGAVVGNPLVWWTAAAFLVLETYTIDLPLKAQRHSYSMSEIPTVFGLFYLAPDALTVAATLGMALNFLSVRRQRGLRLFFNVSLQLAMIVMQLAVFEAIANARDPEDATAMVATFAAMALNALTSHIAVSAAIRWVEGVRARALFWRGLWLSFGTQLANASFGLVLVLLYALDWRAIFILVTPVAMLYIAYRAMANRMLAEEKLRASERRFAALIHGSSDITALIGSDGVLQYVSDAAADLLGVDTSDIRGRHAAELFHGAPEDASRFREVLDGVLKGNRAAVINICARRPDGSDVELEVNLTDLLSDPGVEAVLMSARDTTERHRLEEGLRQAQKMEAVGQLAGGIAHDFNNLLAVIQNYAEFVRSDLPPNSRSAGDVDEIVRATETASSLTRQLLSFARREIVSPRVVNVNDLVSGMYRMLSRTIRESIELRTALAPDLPHVRIDPGRLEQVLINLAVNAKDAMPEGGKLVIRTFATRVERRPKNGDSGDHYVVISVADTGMGMAPEVQPHIFEPFFTTKAKGEGTGLGLATVYGIVNQFQGHIEVDSRIGEGTEFRIFLPATTEDVGAISEGGAARPPGQSATILVAEDSEPLRNLIERILTRASYEVLSAASGADAFGVWQERAEEIDLLVTDVVMPQMSGRELSELTGMPTVFISGYTDEIISQDDVSDGGFFLQKPFSRDDLLRVVGEALRSAERAEA